MNNQFADSLISFVFASDDSYKVNTLLDRFGLNWRVNMIPLVHSSTGNPTPFFGIVREDTLQTFAPAGKNYNPFQNAELADLVLTIAEKTGYEVSKGGSLNGGMKTYLHLNIGEEKNIGKNNDTIIKNIMAINSHDGESSLKWGHTNKTLSCMNQFAAAEGQLKNSARHTSSIQSRVAEALKQIEKLHKSEQVIYSKIGTMTSTPVTQKMVAEVVKQSLGIDILLNADDLSRYYTNYQLNNLAAFLGCISKEMEQKGETTWGLFSGVTNYTTHVMKAPKRENGSLESKYVGKAFLLDNKAFSILS